MTVFYRRQTQSGGNYPPAPPNAPGVPFHPQTLPPNTVVGRLLGTGPTEAIPLSYLLTALLQTAPNVQEITASGTVTVLSTTDIVVLNKTVASATPITLGSVTLRNNRKLLVFDWTGLCGDITFTPNGTEKINNRSSWIVGSGGAGLGGSLELIPMTDLSGWLAQ